MLYDYNKQTWKYQPFAKIAQLAVVGTFHLASDFHSWPNAIFKYWSVYSACWMIWFVVIQCSNSQLSIGDYFLLHPTLVRVRVGALLTAMTGMQLTVAGKPAFGGLSASLVWFQGHAYSTVVGWVSLLLGYVFYFYYTCFGWNRLKLVRVWLDCLTISSKYCKCLRRHLYFGQSGIGHTHAHS